MLRRKLKGKSKFAQPKSFSPGRLPSQVNLENGKAISLWLLETERCKLFVELAESTDIKEVSLTVVWYRDEKLFHSFTLPLPSTEATGSRSISLGGLLSESDGKPSHQRL